MARPVFAVPIPPFLNKPWNSAVTMQMRPLAVRANPRGSPGMLTLLRFDWSSSSLGIFDDPRGGHSASRCRDARFRLWVKFLIAPGARGKSPRPHLAVCMEAHRGERPDVLEGAGSERHGRLRFCWAMVVLGVSRG